MTRPLRPLAALLALAAFVAGCASTKGGPAPEAAPAPAPASQGRAVSDFGAALRCMDSHLADFGVRDLTLQVEDILDSARRPLPAAKDALVAAVTDMTVRSRAIRVLADARRQGAPGYVLRGAANDTDLQVAMLHDGTVMPGVASRNAVRRVKQGAEVIKLGTTFHLPAGQQPTRPLIELAAIEVVGRLAKVPYWTCLGVANGNEVVAEIRDWYDAMAEEPAEIIRYFQHQLRLRKAYDGPVDGRVSGAFKDGVARYREALGLTREAQLSVDFFQAFITADHRRIAAQIAPPPEAAAAPAAPAPAPVSAPTPAPVVPPPQALALHVATTNASPRFTRGEVVHFAIRPTRDAHVYCYLQDENRAIQRVFPNRFQRDSRIDATKGLQLPGQMKFEIVMNSRGVPEHVLCLATARDVLQELPAAIAGRDFEPLTVKSLDQVRSAFANTAGPQLAHDHFVLQPR